MIKVGTVVTYKGKQLYVGGADYVRGHWRYCLVEHLSDLHSVVKMGEGALRKLLGKTA